MSYIKILCRDHQFNHHILQCNVFSHSVPTIPLNPRVYILEDKDIKSGNSSFSADIRWETVEKTNGILLGYKIYWGTSADSLLQMVEAGPEAVQYTLDGLDAGMTFFFKVRCNKKILNRRNRTYAPVRP